MREKPEEEIKKCIARNDWHANLAQIDEASGRDGHETCELHHDVCRQSQHQRPGEGGAQEEKLIYGEN